MKYIVSIDQSTSGTKAALLDESLAFVKTLRKSHEQYYPEVGYAEHDAEEIWQNTVSLLNELTKGISKEELGGIGIANQRETTVLWDRETGRPVGHAIVWQDVRATDITGEIPEEAAEEILKRTGLVVSPYYSAAKAASVIRHDPEAAKKAAEGTLCIGTVDTYLLYRMTKGESFATDFTNAARTQLFNIHELTWDPFCMEQFGITREMVARDVLSSNDTFGTICAEELPELNGLPILAMLGDSNASFFGHRCLEPGMVKTSYGTGSSIMLNTGTTPVLSAHGLSTSIGSAIDGTIHYILEGNITCSADTLIWVKDGMQLISDMEELDLAATVPSTDGVYLVPAFSGLGAPWFDEQARAILFGMNRGTTKAHILRAALASIAHQNADVLQAMEEDTGIKVTVLRADGGGCVNETLMQMQSDYSQCRVIASDEKELTLKGAALMAATKQAPFDGADKESAIRKIYDPVMDAAESIEERDGWKHAVSRCR